MAARKSARTTAKKATRTVRGKAKSAVAPSRLDRLTRDLPPTLQEFSKQVRRRLNQLESEIAKAQVAYRKQAAHLLRTASHRLGELEAKGEGAWRRLAEPARKEVVRLLGQLEKAIAPQAKSAKKAVREARKTVDAAAKRVERVVDTAAAKVERATAAAVAALPKPPAVPHPSRPFSPPSDGGPA